MMRQTHLLHRCWHPCRRRIHKRFFVTKRQNRIAAETVTSIDPPDPRHRFPSHTFRNIPQDNDTIFSMQQASELYNPEIHLPSAPQDWTGYEPATPLTHELVAWIGVSGRPLSTARYMQLALTHPEYGYYTRAMSAKDDFDDDDDVEDEQDNVVIGADFVTAPEISQVFGECLGVWYYTQWKEQECKSWQWLECGPGKGSLTVDLLSFASQLSDSSYLQGLQHIHLVEMSPVLREIQKKALMELADKRENVQFAFESDEQEGIQVRWHDSFEAFQVWNTEYKEKQESLSTFAVCQEFLDALPVHQFEKTETGVWRERLVDVAVREDAMDDSEKEHATTRAPKDMLKPRLRIVLAPEVTSPLQTLLNVDPEGKWKDDGGSSTGSVIEVSPDSILLAQDMKALVQQGGACLVIDYGQEGSTDSIRGFSKHEQVPFLSLPGQVDVTADVDFTALRHVCGEEQSFGPVSQGQFLVSMGLQERVIQLIEQDWVTDDQAEALFESMVRLASPEEMGERFKVLCIVPKTKDAPAGFQ